MNKEANNSIKYLPIIAVLCIMLLVLGTIFAIDYCDAKKNVKDTLGLTPDEVYNSYGYFYLLMPKDENSELMNDVVSCCLGDNIIFFVLPPNLSNKAVVYALDENDTYLSRIELDFDKECRIGEYYVEKRELSLPVMNITLRDHDVYGQAYETLDKELICYGDMQIDVDKDMAKKNGWFTTYISKEGNSQSEGTISMHGRGNATWEYGPKKSFSLKLEEKMSLLGMAERKKWNLVACPFDNTMLKNMVFNNLATELGIKYQPEMRMVNLFVDGDYCGLYYLTSKIDVGRNDIPLTNGDYLYCYGKPSGEYVYDFAVESFDFEENESSHVSIEYPQNMTEAEKNQVGELFYNFILRLEDASSDEYLEYIDLDEVVNYYWIQEASMNFDGAERSLYVYYKRSDNKFHFGPVWDMELTLGSPFDRRGIYFDSYDGFRMKYLLLYKLLFAHPEFNEAVKDAYINKGVRDKMYSAIDDFYYQREQMGYDAEYNYMNYGHTGRGYTLNYEGDNYYDYTDSMIDFYRNRLLWIDENINNE